ncbi:MAG: hypothetical protein WCQ90_15290 [Deltaproteobacteria bacterium]
MFNALFLAATGDLLIDARKKFDKLSEFTDWRDKKFGVKHIRLLQQAVQLAEMGDFSRRYSGIGKHRLLQLEHIRKTEKMASCEDILRECPVYSEIAKGTLSDKVIQSMDINPFPDITTDIDNNRVKTYVDSVITFKRLKKEGLSYADFEDAQLIAMHYKRAIPVEEAKAIKVEMDKVGEGERPQAFNLFLMDSMRIPSADPSNKKSESSLSKVISDIVLYCENKNLDDEEWLESQKEVISKDSLLRARDFLNSIVIKMQIDVLDSQDTPKEV